MGDGVAVELRDVGVRFDLRLDRPRTLRAALARPFARDGASSRRDFWALRDVTLSLARGETLGIIGRNGAGKSTLLLTMAGILAPDRGIVRRTGRVSTLLALGAGLSHDLSGRDNVWLGGALLGLDRRVIAKRLDEIVAFADLGDFIDAPMRTYSSGMRARLGFAIAAHIDPDILLIDEVVGVGDAEFQKKSRAKLEELASHATAIAAVTHDMQFVRRTCSRAVWLDGGRVAASGDPGDVAERYEAAQVQQGRPAGRRA